MYDHYLQLLGNENLQNSFSTMLKTNRNASCLFGSDHCKRGSSFE